MSCLWITENFLRPNSFLREQKVFYVEAKTGLFSREGLSHSRVWVFKPKIKLSFAETSFFCQGKFLSQNSSCLGPYYCIVRPKRRFFRIKAYLTEEVWFVELELKLSNAETSFYGQGNFLRLNSSFLNFKYFILRPNKRSSFV